MKNLVTAGAMIRPATAFAIIVPLIVMSIPRVLRPIIGVDLSVTVSLVFRFRFLS